MNNNRGNNRRRGRNNRSQGGGQHLNRIDSRARGNAPQLLDKYKKLAEEAHRNGDRVQAEYYLQFADHYFRVIADGKVRQDEQRQRRDDDRSDRDNDDDTDSSDNNENNDNNDSEGETEAENDGDNRRRRRKEPTEANPFTRDNRQRRQRRPKDDEAAADNAETEEAVKSDGGLDPSALPPAIGETEEKPKRRGRPRKVKVEASEDDADVKQAVNG
ncbi:DUF4167 domain-containing protein [Croceicoccus bisphenolivorans]|uniref:DUF4167 domain-containing protein n=1 Tax=Croceicoccus bisphenolivorans TaxID=1783232 RepID=UPI00082A7131|nr:DUF4167 domain-containing protein [Croceicoccus bisphenolivorans]